MIQQHDTMMTVCVATTKMQDLIVLTTIIELITEMMIDDDTQQLCI